MQKDVLLFGIQGCGKGTQAKIFLENHKNFKYFEPGNIFRALSSNQNIFSDYVTARVQAGKLVEDKLVFGLFDCGSGLVDEGECLLLDGFPRNLSQKDHFEDQWNKLGRDFVCVNFNLSREKAIERIKKRAIDQGRADDAKDEVIEKRLETFEKETLPVIQAFEKEGKVITIDADQSIENIYNELVEKIA